MADQKEDNTFNFTFRHALSPHTIQGKVIWASIVFIGIIFSFTSIVFLKSETIATDIAEVIEYGKPTTHHVNQIQQGVANASKAMRGYFITNQEEYRKERSAAWREIVNPSLSELSILAQSQPDDFKAKIDRLERLLNDYQNIQRELEVYYLENQQEVDVDKQSNAQMVAAFEAQQALQEYLKKYFANFIQPQQQDIYTFLKELMQQEEDRLETNLSKVQANTSRFKTTMLAILLISLGLTSAVAYVLVISLQKSISRPIGQIEKIAQGELPENIEASKDELNAIITAINQLKTNIRKASEFALSIGEGNLQQEFEPVSDNDMLGNALIQMRKRLQEVALDDQRRNWANEGLAEFSDIMRDYQEDFEVLSDRLVTQLVRYTEANQGGLFILNEDREGKQFLELKAAYAYNRKKYLEKKIAIEEEYGEGIIGQAFLERKTLQMNKVPQNYVMVTSGLGEATPDNLLLVPLEVNEVVEGMIELISFRPFAPHEVKFVEELAESIASTLVTVKNSDKMKRLLEDSQQKSEQLRAQEEEMRQNMEELSATQEEMQRKQRELERIKNDLEQKLSEKEDQLQQRNEQGKLLDALHGTMYTRAASLEAPFSFVSKGVENLLGYPEEDLLSGNYTLADFIHPNDRGKVAGQIEQAVANQQPLSVRYRLVRPDGKVLLVLDKAKIIEEAEGVALRGFITDITGLRPRGDIK